MTTKWYVRDAALIREFDGKTYEDQVSGPFATFEDASKAAAAMARSHARITVEETKPPATAGQP